MSWIACCSICCSCDRSTPPLPLDELFVFETELAIDRCLLGCGWTNNRLPRDQRVSAICAVALASPTERNESPGRANATSLCHAKLNRRQVNYSIRPASPL